MLKINNPGRLYVMAQVGPRDSGKMERCGVDNANPVALTCPLPAHGRYRAIVFTNTELAGTYRQAAALDLIRQ